MKEIINGFLNFQQNVFPERKDLFKSLASNQNPKALFISCSDSRLVPELVTQQEPGELFVIRNAGNIVPSFGPRIDARAEDSGRRIESQSGVVG